MAECPNCKTQNTEGSRFCSNCGFAFASIQNTPNINPADETPLENQSYTKPYSVQVAAKPAGPVNPPSVQYNAHPQNGPAIVGQAPFSAQPQKKKKNVALIIFLVLFYPAGIAYLLFLLWKWVWKDSNWSKKNKWLATGAVLFTPIVVIGIGSCQEYVQNKAETNRVAELSATPAGRTQLAYEKKEAANKARQEVEAQQKQAREEQKQQVAEASKAATEKANSDRIGEPLSQIGDVGYLMVPDADANDKAIHVGASKQGLSDMMDSAIAKDDVGFQQVFDKGEAFTVVAGTKARLLDLDGLGVVRVRLIGGNHDTEEAWIPSEWIRKH